ncbi:hybrid sensor histidine kinase/response regulator transcription factor [Pseudoalteromonas sp. Angola-4]|uniref:hybrid sensor histidine kinase/response regulator transcription factor n=1 Tax=Pseudoalteromonas sp. Angola-4 TaxID=3025335 RepID=UPI002359C68A|nr:hybrid sensor histidine kinase/response regulator transcription factor [Pseudoalteromonas sp. Angola-4]MDC9510272.1 two-component regulator propeller domain-containing protein [Pseudoalteromonas sp. Angola-4]
MNALIEVIKYQIFCTILLCQFAVFAKPVYLDIYTNEQGLSQNSITCSTTDRAGFHWFATQGGLNKFDGYEFKHYKFNPSKKGISGNWITDCINFGNKYIWLSTAASGLNLLNTETGKFKVYNQYSTPALKNSNISSITSQDKTTLWIGHNKGQLSKLNTKTNKIKLFTHPNLQQATIEFKDIMFGQQDTLWLASNIGLIKFDTITEKFTLIADSPKQLWRLENAPNKQLLLGSKTGLASFNPETYEFHHIEQLKDYWVTDILFDDEHTLWISTYGHGLFSKQFTSLSNNKFDQISYSPSEKHGLANDHLLSLYQDPTGIIWIGTDGYGLHRYDKKQSQFDHQKHLPNNQTSISHDFVRAILKDSRNTLWIGTRDGLNKQTPEGFKRYKTNNSQGTGLTNNNIFSLYEDSKQRVWVGTYGGGLLLYNRATDQFSTFTEQSHQLSSNRIYAITSDANGNLWLGGNKGLTRFNPDTLKVKSFSYDEHENSISNNTVFSITYDSFNDVIWAGTRSGLNKLSLNNETFTHYISDIKKPNSLTHNMVTSLYLKDQNTLWVGTFNGLNKLNIQTHEIINITEFDGLINGNIFAIKEDRSGYLWLSTNQGLTRYSEYTHQMQHFLPENGIQHNSFILGAAFQASNGELFFGGINGYNQFNPQTLSLHAPSPEPFITDLLINNQPALTEPYINNKKAKRINFTNELFFKEENDVVGFKFTALNSSAAPSQYQFAYQLKGLDSQFLYASKNQRQVSYPQLPAGNYKLIMKVKGQYGKWSNEKTMLSITVTPPWWKSNTAYFIYTLIVLSVLWLFAALKYKAKVAEQERKKEQELNKLKTQLLDNVSHELKTPLSLIMAPLESLKKHHPEADTQQKLTMIQRNSQRLLNQINQLLQLSQRPSTAVKRVTPYPIQPLVDQIIEDFSPLFVDSNIQFEFKNLTKHNCYITLEYEHITSIINNLLSNAHKYTPPHGQASLTLSNNNDGITISVSDTGIGINKQHVDAIFERFTRINATNTNGNGIGLALVKQLVEQYEGTVTVTSEINKGSCFTVLLPSVEMKALSLQTALHLQKDQKPPLVKTHKILIIEDNDEMRDLLTSIFCERYSCIDTTNGEHGIKLCKREMPDLVISDVMMPIMDGYQFIKSLRNDVSISHIPTLLLSAKADTQSKLKGLDLLADDYLSKPFEPELLLSRVQGLLTIRKVLNQHLKQQLPALSQSIKLDPQMIQSKDYEFTERVKNVVKKHYQNDEFSVEDFAASLYLSPRALQLKMKALYGLTPSDYIRNIRLEFAQSLLSDTDLAIGLVAQQVGFSSQSYFARCFKAHYSISPKQFRDQKP